MRQAVEDISKLPKWAQSRIRVLEQNLAVKTGELEEVYGGKPTNIIIPNYVTGKNIPLPKDSQILFNPNTQDAISARIEYDKPTTLIISADRSLLVTPWATNMIKIRVEPR